MSDEICILFGEDGKAHAYNSEFDVTIHCENEREMNDAVALLNLANHCEVLRIHDNQSTDEDSGEIVYKIAQVMEFCQRCNAAILSEQENLRNSPDEYVRELRKDEALLNRLVAAAWHAVPFASVHLLDRIMRRNAQKA